MADFVSRAGHKLDHALTQFQMDVAGFVCADLGCNAGGFVDCLLQRGATKVYAIDTGYGALDWKLRKDPRVVVMERTNAMHAELPEKVDLVTIDVAWTRQRNILPAARRMMKEEGSIVSLVKPHYEAPPTMLTKGVLPPEQVEAVVKAALEATESIGLHVVRTIESPIRGGKGNVEVLAWLRTAGISTPPLRLEGIISS